MGEAPDHRSEDLIREEIEATRARMGERADALAYKADVPARSKDKVHGVVDNIKGKVTDMAHQVSGTTQSAAGSVSDRASAVSGKASGKASAVSGRASAATDQAGEKAKQAKSLAEDNPLGLAIGSIALGFLAGLAVPSTRVEQEKLGPLADQATAKVKEVGQDLGERAKDVASTTQEAVQGAVKDQASDVKENASSSS